MPPADDGPRWFAYVFRQPNRAALAGWVRRLRYFRFVKAQGGFAQDGDELLVALRYAGSADLQHLLAQLGLPPLPTLAPDYQPPGGLVALAGERGYLTVQPNYQRLSLGMHDPTQRYNVTEATVAAAEKVEAVLAAHAARVIDPPEASPRCVCPAYYPELWAEPTTRRG